MKLSFRSICDLIIGLLCVGTAVIGYHTDFSYMGEYCFLSGIAVGVVFLISFVRRIKTKKDFPVWLYFDCMFALLIILLATVTIGLNLEGAFWFIHIIDPILVFTYWCVFCDHREIRKISLVSTNIVFPAAYLLFAFLLRQASGNCPFPASILFSLGSIWAILTCIAALLAVFLLLGYALHFFSRLIHKKNAPIQK